MREFNFVSFKTTPPTGRFVFSYKLFTWWPIHFTLYFLCFKYFCLTLKCKKKKAPASWRSLQTITYKYIKCILLHRITVFFFIPIFQVYFYFVDFLWILNIVLSLHIINCSFMLHFVITSNVFLQNSRWKSLFIHVSQWLGSVKSDCYQKRLIINFSWKCQRNELCNIPHFCYKQNYADSLDVVNFLIVLDWFNIFFQPMLCHLWRQLLNNSDAPNLASTAQRPRHFTYFIRKILIYA